MKRAIWAFIFLTLPAYPEKLNLVWQMPPAEIWETDWIKEMLSDFEVNHIEDCKYEKFVDNSIVVVTYWDNFTPYIDKLHAMNYKFGVILLSDEFYKAPTDFYDKAQFVFRNYWHKRNVLHRNVYEFPLGYKTGWKKYRGQGRNIYNREYAWSFAGQLTNKPTRQAMVNSLKQVSNYHIHEIYTWADSKSLHVDDYQSLLLNTIFMPCPTGWWNLDSFRVYEALESGCIPIVERLPIDYFGKYFGDHPFITIKYWDQAAKIMNDLLDCPQELEERRVECYNWWQDYKRKIKSQFSDVVRSKLNL